MVKRALSVIEWGVRAALWLLPVLGVAALLLCVRLASGPVSMPVPERALAALMDRVAPGMTMTVAGAEFDLFGTDGLTGLKLRDVMMRDEAGQMMAALPEIGLSMVLSWGGTVDIRGVRVRGARLDVVRGATGDLRLDMDGMTGEGIALSSMSGNGTAPACPVSS